MDWCTRSAVRELPACGWRANLLVFQATGQAVSQFPFLHCLSNGSRWHQRPNIAQTGIHWKLCPCSYSTNLVFQHILLTCLPCVVLGAFWTLCPAYNQIKIFVTPYQDKTLACFGKAILDFRTVKVWKLVTGLCFWFHMLRYGHFWDNIDDMNKSWKLSSRLHFKFVNFTHL